MLIREQKHRLSHSVYQGEINVAFTLCIKDRFPLFNNDEIVEKFIGIMSSLVKKFYCTIPVYCFMPDHQHILVAGANGQANLLEFIKHYQQQTGYWLSKNHPQASWQKDFYDHVLRKDEDRIEIIKYILANPVRKGLVSHWREYPFKGAIGWELEDILQGMI